MRYPRNRQFQRAPDLPTCQNEIVWIEWSHVPTYCCVPYSSFDSENCCSCAWKSPSSVLYPDHQSTHRLCLMLTAEKATSVDGPEGDRRMMNDGTRPSNPIPEQVQPTMFRSICLIAACSVAMIVNVCDITTTLYILISQVALDRKCYERIDCSAFHRHRHQNTTAAIAVANFCLLVELGTVNGFGNAPASRTAYSRDAFCFCLAAWRIYMGARKCSL